MDTNQSEVESARTLAIVRELSEHATLRPAPRTLRCVPIREFICKPVPKWERFYLSELAELLLSRAPVALLIVSVMLLQGCAWAPNSWNVTFYQPTDGTRNGQMVGAGVSGPIPPWGKGSP